MIKVSASDGGGPRRCPALAGHTCEVLVGAAMPPSTAAGIGDRAAIGSVHNFAAQLHHRMPGHVMHGGPSHQECPSLAGSSNIP